MSVREQMQKRLAAIDYDFSRFRLTDFVHWLEQQRGRAIELVPCPMPAHLYGAWVPSTCRDYIFYDAQAAPVHQLHIQLYELAHLLCDHQLDRVTEEQLILMLSASADALQEHAFLRASDSSDKEAEAEILAGLMYEQILRYNRIAAFTTDAVPIAIADYWRAMEIR